MAASTAVVAAGLVGFSVAAPAAAAAPLKCIGSIYVTTGSTIREVDLTTRALVPGNSYTALPSGAGSTPNQIGVGANGAVAIHGTSTSIVRYTPAIDQTTVIAKPSGVGAGTVGAVNPLNGLFYYGAYSGNTLNLYVYNPATTTATPGIVAAVTVNNAPGANGDIAFDEAGRLYLVAGDGSSPYQAALYRAIGTVPTTPTTPVTTLTSTEITRGNNTGGTNGIAFASDGYLYISTGSAIRQLNPITGATVGTDITLSGAGITDLGTCAGPTTVTGETGFPSGPVKPGDTFTPVVGGGGQPNPVPGTPTQPTQPTIVIPGTPVTVDQTPGTGTVPGQYVTTWQCRSLDGTLIGSGTGTPGTFTPPTGTDGNSITCSISNDLPRPSLTLTKTVSPGSFSVPGTVLTYTFTATNTGNTVLTNVGITDPMPGISGLTCNPPTGSTLLPAASYLNPVRPAGTMTCTATYAVTPADVAAGANKVNTATVSGTPPTGQGTTVSQSSNPATATFVAVPPVATDDAANTPFNTAVTLPGSQNDTPGNGAIQHNLTVFTAPGTTNGGKTLTAPQGTWQIDGDGRVTFTPTPGFVGTTPAVEYRITDSNGQSDTATVQVTVRPGPVANPDARTTLQDVAVTVPVIDNDAAGQNADGTPGTKVATSVVFPTTGQPAGANVTDAGRTLTVPGQGVYTADATTGLVTFDPEPTFTGAATPVSYSFSDSVGGTAISTITITVTAVNPVATDDAVNTVFGTAVTLPAGTNDIPGPGGEIDHALTVFTSDEATNGGKSLTTPEGTWQIQPDGTVVFDPATGYVGTTPTVEYEITDANGQSDTATLEVTVRPGPSAVDDAATTPQNVTVSFPVLDDDTAGLRVDGTEGALDPTSFAFQTTGLPAGSEASPDRHTLTVPGEGVYTWDPVDERVTFDPEPTFAEVASPVTYTVLDQEGNVASATITVTVTPITPTATDNSAKTPAGTAVTFDVAGDDVPGADSAPIDIESVLFTSGAATQGGTVLVVPGEGTWTVVDGGSVSFAPEAGFAGPTTPVEYSVADANGTRATADLTVVVGTPPLAAPDSTTTPQNTDVVLPVLVNDVAGDLGAACEPGTPGEPAGCDTGTLDATSVVFPEAGQPDDAVVSDGGRTLTVPGEGVYTVDPTTGDVTFDPEAAFTGATTPVTYAVTDSYANTATATITVTVLAITPTATDDQLPTPFNTAVTLPGATNDTPGTLEGVTPAIEVGLTVFPTDGQPDGTEVGTDGKTLTVEGEGTYVINPDGTVTFTPVDGFVGPTTGVTYRITDANGTTDDAVLSVLVRPGPTANADVRESLQGQPVVLDPSQDDTPGRTAEDGEGSFDGALTVFPTEGQGEGVEVADGGKTLTVDGEGVYRIDADGVVTFTPEPSFAGTTTPVVYQVTDQAGNPASATITIIVEAIQPTAVADEASTPFATDVTFPFAANDVAGNDVAPIDPASGTFEAADLPGGVEAVIGDEGTTLTVAGEGTWTLLEDGTVTFSPEGDFSGVTTSVVYTIRDTNGTPTTATLTVTVRPGPVAEPDTASTPQNVPVERMLLTNDTPGPNADGTDGAWLSGGTVFPAEGQPAGAEVSEDGYTLTVPGEGVYTVTPEGVATFAPEPAFRGEATPVTYAVTDSHGNTATATLAITVVGIDPTATPDAGSTPYLTAVTIPGAANDTAGADTAPLVPDATVFPAEGQPEGSEPSEDGKTLVVPGQGTWTVVEGGQLTFAPEPGFAGETTPVTYQIVDTNGTTDTATGTVTVRPGPVAENDVNTTPQNVDVTTSVVGNDTPGQNADTSAGTWVLDSLTFPVDGQPDGAERSEDGRTLTVPGEGVYTVVTEGDEAGSITFDPEPAFRTVATPIPYQVTDSLGNAATATLTITVTGIDPVVTPDTGETPFNTPVTIPGAANDTGGADSAPLVPEATVFPAEGQPEGATPSEDGKTLVVPGQGTWTVVEGGQLTFTPEPGYTGTTTPVTYQVVDTNGTPGTGTGTVTVRPGPVAAPDTDTTAQNVTVTVDVIGNDTPGQNADGSLGTWDAIAVVFPAEGQPEGAQVSPDGRTLTVPGEGVYTVVTDGDEVGSITFDPEPAFRDQATPITYTVTDNHGNPASATLTITVSPIDPTATDDAASTPFGTPVVLRGATNDAAGAESAPLVPGATVFPLVEGQPLGATISPDGKTLTVEGEGTYVVATDGSVTFTPADGFEGPTTPVIYQIADANGTTDTATLTVTVQDGPTAADDSDVTPQNVDVTIDVLENDSPGLTAEGEPGEWDTTSVVFPVEGQPEGAQVSPDGRTLTLPGQGVWTVVTEGDEAGRITFDPEPAFRGETADIRYEVTDSLGNPASALLTVTVTGIDPVATDDSAPTPFATPVTLPGSLNDRPGAPSAPLVHEATVFPVDGQPEGSERSEDGKQLVVPGQGTWTVNPDGSLTFTPEPGFDGPTTPVTYQVSDANGTTDTATATVTVRPGPVAQADSTTTPQGVAVTVPVIGNDTPGQNADGSAGELVPASVVFPTEGQPEGAQVSEDGKEFTLEGVGTWAVDPETGAITFTPVPAFRGEAPAVTYAVTDSLGNPATAPLTVVVTGIDPVAVADEAQTPYLTPVTVPVLVNDAAGADSAPLVPGSVRFPLEGQPEGAQVSEDGTTLVVPGQGTWTAGEDGTITFTPVPGFTGGTTPVTYEVSDANGTTATAPVTVTVRPGPAASPDQGAGQQGLPVVIDPLGNDTPGENADGTAGALDPTSVVFPGEGQPEGAQVSEDGKQLTVPGVGTYVIDPVTGQITFTPDPTFTGTTPPVTYEVTDSHGNPATSTVVVVVGPVTPGATDDRASTAYRTPVTLDVLANDTSGSPEIPLDAATLRLLDGAGNLVETLEVPGEGTWTVVDGALVFTPADGFTGTTTPVTYSVADANGTRVTATAVVDVRTTGQATPDTATTPGGTPVTVPVLDNDFPGKGADLDPSTVCLLPGGPVTAGDAPAATLCVKKHTVDGVGTWVVNPDGTITFTPVDGYAGDASINYQVSDTEGTVYSSTVTVTVQKAPENSIAQTGASVLGLSAGALALLLAGAWLVRRRQGRTA